MKLKSAIFILLILFLNILLYSNEKETYGKNKISFDFNQTSNDKACKNGINNDREYIRKANGFLAMGIIGTILVSLSVPASVVFTALLIYFIPSMAYYIFLLVFIPLFPFLGAGVPMLVCGFIFYNRYKNKKTPNPFSSNKTSFIKFNISLKGANNV